MSIYMSKLEKGIKKLLKYFYIVTDLLRRLPHDGHVLSMFQPHPLRLPERKLLEGIQRYPLHRIKQRKSKTLSEKNFF